MSTTRETVTAWLKEVSGGEENFEYRDDGVYTYAVAEGLEVNVEIPDTEGLVYFYAPIAGLPEEGLESFYARVLRMNLLNIQTRGATLALDDRGRAITLCYTLPTTGMDVVAFGNLLGNFIETAKAVKETLGSQGAQIPESLSEPQISGMRV